MAQSAQIKGINPWHRNLADWLIVNGNSPGWNKRASEYFKVSQAWISTVVHSDAFKDYYQRLASENSQTVLHSTRDKLIGTLDVAIEKVQERIEDQGSSMPLSNLLDCVEVLAKRTGHGSEGASSGQSTIINNLLVVSKEELAESRARMRGASAKPLVLEASRSAVETSHTDEQP